MRVTKRLVGAVPHRGVGVFLLGWFILKTSVKSCCDRLLLEFERVLQKIALAVEVLLFSRNCWKKRPCFAS